MCPNLFKPECRPECYENGEDCRAMINEFKVFHLNGGDVNSFGLSKPAQHAMQHAKP